MKSLSLLKAVVFTALLSMGMVGAANAADVATPAEAEAMVNKAVALIKSAGPEKAYEEITNGKSLKDRELYVTVQEFGGKNLAHGANSKMIGKDLSGLKTPDGKLPTKMMLDIAQGPGQGWTEEFTFMNPVTQKMQAKRMYVQRVGDTYVACGAYKS